ncbi:hypothetical protein HK413_08210 [Mucilaginibacter sp. S1162]|uniref:Uncharacterized protein n=1 Tax=Mucilaginibacter humi TaxID=2732510 RepID=A0ABX1W2E5_9SPHI|nr:hypothetical protein [Mucilaginibacter humi]NNU34133.1 hypothetical protein [Mucilaginibacter humi]
MKTVRTYSLLLITAIAGAFTACQKSGVNPTDTTTNPTGPTGIIAVTTTTARRVPLPQLPTTPCFW